MMNDNFFGSGWAAWRGIPAAASHLRPEEPGATNVTPMLGASPSDAELSARECRRQARAYADLSEDAKSGTRSAAFSGISRTWLSLATQFERLDAPAHRPAGAR
jgi:hypothetical protein